jgi:hypothetical protein
MTASLLSPSDGTSALPDPREPAPTALRAAPQSGACRTEYSLASASAMPRPPQVTASDWTRCARQPPAIVHEGANARSLWRGGGAVVAACLASSPGTGRRTQEMGSGRWGGGASCAVSDACWAPDGTDRKARSELRNLGVAACARGALVEAAPPPRERRTLGLA